MFSMLRKMGAYPRLTLGYPAVPMDDRRFVGCPAIDARPARAFRRSRPDDADAPRRATVTGWP